MYNQQVVDFINKHCYRSNNQLRNLTKDGWWIKNNFLEYKKYILEKTHFLDISSRWAQRIWHIKASKFDYVRCRFHKCDNILEWSTIKSAYPVYCSSICGGTAPETKEKFKITCQQRYGVDAPMQSAMLVQKYKDSVYETWGVDSFSKTDLFKEKTKKTCNEQYGVNNPMHVTAFKQKRIDTCNDLYGVPYPMQNLEVLSNRTATNLKLYGYASPMGNEQVKENHKNSMMKLYGVKNNKHLLLSEEAFNTLHDSELLTELLKTNSTRTAATKLDVDIGTILNYVRKHGLEYLTYIGRRSYLEKDMELFLEMHEIEFLANSKSIIPPKQLDFYLPNYKLAIELGGTYWHSEFGSNKSITYHIGKWNECNNKNINLLTYFEYEINANISIIEDTIISLISPEIVDISSAEVVEITEEVYTEFQTMYSFEKPALGTYFGVICNNRLLAVASLDADTVITSYTVRGILDKTQLLEVFYNYLKTRYSKIYAIVNNSYGYRCCFEALGFEVVDILPPKPIYTQNYIPVFDKQDYLSTLTEFELKEHSYDRIWNTGYTKLIRK